MGSPAFSPAVCEARLCRGTRREKDPGQAPARRPQCRNPPIDTVSQHTPPELFRSPQPDAGLACESDACRPDRAKYPGTSGPTGTGHGGTFVTWPHRSSLPSPDLPPCEADKSRSSSCLRMSHTTVVARTPQVPPRASEPGTGQCSLPMLQSAQESRCGERRKQALSLRGREEMGKIWLLVAEARRWGNVCIKSLEPSYKSLLMNPWCAPVATPIESKENELVKEAIERTGKGEGGEKILGPSFATFLSAAAMVPCLCCRHTSIGAARQQHVPIGQ